MYLEKFKTVLIYIFIGVNVFLLSTLLVKNYNAKRVEKDLVNTTVSLLLKNNISISGDLISRTKEDVSVVNIEGAYLSKDAFAEAVFGTGGYEKNEDNFVSQKGTLEFKENEFFLVLKNGVLKGGDSFKTAQNILSSIGLTGKSFKVISEETIEGGTRLCLLQYYKKTPLWGARLYMDILNNGEVRLGGFWASEKVKKEPEEDSIGAVPILFQLINCPDRAATLTVSEIEPILYINAKDRGYEYKSFQAIPCLAVKTKEGRIFLYDVREGIDAGSRYLGFEDAKILQKNE